MQSTYAKYLTAWKLPKTRRKESKYSAITNHSQEKILKTIWGFSLLANMKNRKEESGQTAAKSHEKDSQRLLILVHEK